MSEPSSTGPAPSKHVFLHELSKQQVGTKVRFLCCAFDYDSSKGHLLVEHAYPLDAHSIPRAAVDVNLIRETTKAELMENGHWVNVIGYVQSVPQAQGRIRKRNADVNGSHDGGVLVQALLMWDAGAVRVNMYETVLEAQRQAWRKTREIHQRAS